MKLRLVTVAATVGVIATMLPTHAATTAASGASKPQITDQAGDANGVNNQGLTGSNNVSIAAPADDSNGDITSVLFQTKFKTVTTTKTVVVRVKKKKVTKKVTVATKVPDGVRVTLNLSAAPDGNHAYDVQATNPACENGYIDFTYSTGQLGLNEVDCFPTDPTSVDFTTLGGEAKVVGNSVVWDVPAGVFPTGSVFSGMSAQTEISPTLAPIMDQADGGDATFKVGQ
jgi:hypothetical protein